MAGPVNSKVAQQARRALDARKNEDKEEWLRVSIPAVREKIKGASDLKQFLQGPEGESIARWNGTFAPDILYEKRSDGFFANVLYCVESQGGSSVGDLYRYVQMVKLDSSDEWLYVQTLTATADALASASTRLRSTPAEAEKVFQERMEKRAKKISSASDRFKGLTLTVNDVGGSVVDSRVSSVSDLAVGSDISCFTSDVDSDDEGSVGLFSPARALSPNLQSTEMLSSDGYAQQRRTREAMEQVRQTLGGVLALSNMLGLSQQQFMACVHDICALSDSSPRLP